MHKWLCLAMLAGWLGLGCDRRPPGPDRLSLAELKPPATPEELATAYDQLSLELDRLQALPSIGPNSPDFLSAWLRAYTFRKGIMVRRMDEILERWDVVTRADVLRWSALKQRTAEDDRLWAPYEQRALELAEAKGLKLR